MSDIDKLVEDWGERHKAPPVDDETKAAANIVDAIKASPVLDLAYEAKPRSVVVRLIAAAALVAIGIGLGLILRPAATPHRQTAVGTLSQRDLVEVKKVADEIHRLFPEGLRWISKVNGQISFEPAEERRITEGDAPRLLIAYTVLKRDRGGSWKPVSRHDIVTWSDEPVEIKSATPSVLWCHLTEDHVAAIQADIVLKADGRMFHLNREALCTISKPSTVLERHDGEFEYRVVQTVYKI